MLRNIFKYMSQDKCTSQFEGVLEVVGLANLVRMYQDKLSKLKKTKKNGISNQ